MPDDKIITMTEGLLGFSNLTRYVILEHTTDSPFHWLQAVDDPEVAFIIVDPMSFKPDYKVAVPPSDLSDLQLQKMEDAVVCAIVTVPENQNEMTANLQGPLVFNAEKRLAKQLVLYDGPYTTKHKILSEKALQQNETVRMSAA